MIRQRALILGVGLLAMATACRLKPTYPEANIARSLNDICVKEYKLQVETRYEGKSLRTHVWKMDLFQGETEDLHGMSRDSLKTLQDILLSATRVALSTDAKMDFIEIKMADVMSGASMTIWRYVPDIHDSMKQRYGEMEYFSRLVVDVKPGVKRDLENDRKLVLGRLNWDPPLTMSEFLAKQVIMRARRDGADRLVAHADLSEPETLNVVIENWSVISEGGPEAMTKMTDVVHKSATKVIKGYRFDGFRSLVLRDGRGTALGRWAF